MFYLVTIMTHLITTTNSRRRQLWQQLFGQDTLPVLHPRPRWQWLPGRQTEALAYDLDLQALPDGALARLAAYVAQRSGWPYDYAKAAVQGGWAILATNCYLAAVPESVEGKEKPAEDTSLPAFSERKLAQHPTFVRQQAPVYASS